MRKESVDRPGPALSGGKPNAGHYRRFRSADGLRLGASSSCAVFLGEHPRHDSDGQHNMLPVEQCG